MCRKVVFFILALSIFNLPVFGQTIETILSAPDDWNSEIIPFPLGFAPEIDFVGFEDIRFAPGWSDSNSEEFWTYHFTWFIEKSDPMTEDALTEIFNQYFDGLMRLVLEEEADSENINELDKTISLFIKTDEGFSGKMRVFDSFFTKDYIMLHVKVREKTCEESNKQMISFDISPKGFDDEIWKIFANVEIIEACK